MATVQTVYEVLQNIRSVDIAVHQQRCVVVRNRKAGCRRCADACTSGAISHEENQLVISAEKCVGCGTCATACPTCALEALNPNDAALLQAVRAAAKANGGVAVVACRLIVEAATGLLAPDRLVAVECLGRVEESLPVSLAADGIDKLLLVRGACEECEHKTGIATAQTVVDTANELFAMWRSSANVAIVEKFPASVRAEAPAAFDEGRRNFFFRTKDEAIRVTAAAADAALKTPEEAQAEAARETPYVKVMDDGTLPHCLPDRRERLLDGLAALGEPAGGLLTGRLWGHVVIDPELCTSCRMCATFCPTGALRKFDEDGAMGLDHYPADCVCCRCCEDICPEHALQVFNEVLAEDLLAGVAERTPMKPPKYDMKSPTRARTMFRDILGFDGIYDR